MKMKKELVKKNDRNKAFTLIELLAVIVILAIVACIATPIIMTILTNAKKSVYKSQTYMFIDDVYNYYSDLLILGQEDTIGSNTNLYDVIKQRINDKTSTSGEIYYHNGRVAISLKIDKYCYSKNYSDEKLTVKQSSECTIPMSYSLFSYPNNLPDVLKGNNYIVTVDGDNLDLYKDTNAWGQEIDFSIFELSDGNSVEISVKPNFTYDAYVILSNNDINYSSMIKTNMESKTKEDGIITFNLNDPEAKISLVFSTDGDNIIDNDDYHNSVLHLFTNPLGSDSIDESMNGKTDTEGRKIIYYGPGFYDLYATDNLANLTVNDNTHVYISGGAVFATSLRITNADNVLIDGSGIIMSYNSNGEENEWPSGKNGHSIKVTDSRNVEIKNILSNSHVSKQWTTIILNSTNVKLDNYKTVSTQYASNDALDIINSENITVSNSFFRSCDDAITIKGLESTHEQCKWTDKKCDIQQITNINIDNTLLWNDANNSMVLGHEAKVNNYSNINFKNMYVLYNNDDRKSLNGELKEGYYHNSLYDRSVMSIVSIDGSSFNNISWNNIYVNEAERLIDLNFLDYSYNGEWKSEGNANIDGEINGVIINNVVSTSNGSSDYSNQILIAGYANKNSEYFNVLGSPGLYSEAYAKDDSVMKETKNVKLSNIIINGNKVDTSYSKYKIGPYVSNVTIDGACLSNISCGN